MDEIILRALSFGEHCGINKIELDDLLEMEQCLYAAIKDFDGATKEQIENDEHYQYFSAWCDKYLTQEFCDKALGK